MNNPMKQPSKHLKKETQEASNSETTLNDVRTFKYIFIGGGVAAGYFARAFTQEGLAPGELCIISGEAVPPYERTEILTKYITDPAKLSNMFTCNEEQTLAWYARSGIELALSTWVTKFDEVKRRCFTSTGVIYEATHSVVIGTGCHPAKIPVTFVASIETLDTSGPPPKTPKRTNPKVDGLFDVTGIRDADALNKFLEERKPRKAVVIGASATGLSMCSYLSSRIPTTLISRAERVMIDMLPEQVSLDYHKVLEAGGVELLMGDRINDVLASGGKFIGVRTESGNIIEADLCMMAIGRVPNVDLFRECGIVVRKRNRSAIAVDSSLETNVRNVFAVGDILSLPLQQFNGHGVSCGLQSADQARRSAAHAVKSILSPNPEFRVPYEYFPIQYSRFMDRKWRVFGDISAQETILAGSGDTRAVAVHVWDDRVVGSFIESGKPSELLLLEAATRQQSRINVAKAREATTVEELMEVVIHNLDVDWILAGTNPRTLG